MARGLLGPPGRAEALTVRLLAQVAALYQCSTRPGTGMSGVEALLSLPTASVTGSLPTTSVSKSPQRHGRAL